MAATLDSSVQCPFKSDTGWRSLPNSQGRSVPHYNQLLSPTPGHLAGHSLPENGGSAVALGLKNTSFAISSIDDFLFNR
ncbi:MAG: hypothetical protein ACI835_004248 [Planctomycetota bacterium]|jgi:hypothetical protein